MRREVTVELSSQGFWKTGIRSDVCQVTPSTPTRARVHTNAHTAKGARTLNREA